MSDQKDASRAAGRQEGNEIDRRSLLLGSGALLAGLLSESGESATAAETARPPHIVYILSDDQGWKDVGFHGSDIKTPNLDRLAETGAELETFYSQAICTPTRAALLTGRYPMRYGLQTGAIPSGGRYGLATDEWLLPQALRAAGYETALVGKWHLGHAEKKYWPCQRGFDHFYGPLVGEIDHFSHEAHGVIDWWRDNKPLEEPGYDTTLFGDEAVRLISAHDPNKPLFLDLSFTAPHTPYEAPAKYLDRYQHITDPSRRAYAAMITAMDEQIGRVVAALEARQMRDNTLIVFQSDNGGTRSAKFTGESKVVGELPPNNGPYRGGKGSLYEGGTRVVAFANWPGRIKPGKVGGMIHITDMYPTLIQLAGGKLGRSKPLDGMDVWSTISTGAASPRTEVVYNVDPFLAAVRRDDWKLVWHALLPGRIELFDLPKDPSEKTDLSDKNPEKVEELQGRIQALAVQMEQPLVLTDALSLVLGLPPSTPLDAIEDFG